MKRLFEVITRMAAVRRYSNRKMLSPENVLEHTGAVSVIALSILGNLRRNGLAASIGLTDEEELALFRSMPIHDIDEIITGDIPRPTKYAVSELRAILHSVERASMHKLVDEYDLPKEWYEFWDSAKAGRVGLILVVADIVSVVYKYWEERVILGNKIFDLVGSELKGELQILIDRMKEKDDSFCASFCLDISKPGIPEYIDYMSGLIEHCLGILATTKESDEFYHAGSVIGSYLTDGRRQNTDIT